MWDPELPPDLCSAAGCAGRRQPIRDRPDPPEIDTLNVADEVGQVLGERDHPVGVPAGQACEDLDCSASSKRVVVVPRRDNPPDADQASREPSVQVAMDQVRVDQVNGLPPKVPIYPQQAAGMDVSTNAHRLGLDTHPVKECDVLIDGPPGRGQQKKRHVEPPPIQAREQDLKMALRAANPCHLMDVEDAGPPWGARHRRDPTRGHLRGPSKSRS